MLPLIRLRCGTTPTLRILLTQCGAQRRKIKSRERVEVPRTRAVQKLLQIRGAVTIAIKERIGWIIPVKTEAFFKAVAHTITIAIDALFRVGGKGIAEITGSISVQIILIGIGPAWTVVLIIRNPIAVAVNQRELNSTLSAILPAREV